MPKLNLSLVNPLQSQLIRMSTMFIAYQEILSPYGKKTRDFVDMAIGRIAANRVSDRLLDEAQRKTRTNFTQWLTVPVPK